MRFNFELFKTLATKVYNGVAAESLGISEKYGGLWETYSLNMVLKIFWFYFQKYEEAFREPHPPIRTSQIQRIIEAMPYVDRADIGGYGFDIDPDSYIALIKKHFQTQYRNCDYNINHFFSGDIRLMRYYEECY